MNLSKRVKLHIPIRKSPAVGRLAAAFLLAIAFLCIWGNEMTVCAVGSYKPVKARIEFDCRPTEGLKENRYQIRIKSESQAAPAPDWDTVTVNGSGKGEFTVEVTEPGTYEYTLCQIKGSDKKIAYDHKQYDVYVNVESDANGELVYTVAVTIAGTDKKPERVEFCNRRAGMEETTEVPTDKTEEVDTGDRSGVLFYLILAGISLAGLIAIIREIKIRES